MHIYFPRRSATRIPARRSGRVIESLESRCLLATYTGTSGPDTVVISSQPFTNNEDITVNGTQFVTADAQITINTLGGDDIVYAPGMANGINQAHIFTINLGDGNDEFTNVNAGGGTRSLDEFTATSTINDGTGNDSIVLNDADGSAFKNYTLDSNAAGYYVDVNAGAGQEGQMLYSSTLESLSITDAAHGEHLSLNRKPSALNLSVFGQAGQDIFTVGGGDLDSNGWSNVILDGGVNGGNIITFDDTSDAFSSLETETYTMGVNSLDKGSANISYTNFSQQTLDVSTTGSTSPVFGETVNLNATSISTAIFASNRYCLINVGATSLASITNNVVLGINGAGYANINDQASSGDKTYTLTKHLANEELLVVSPGPSITFYGGDVSLKANTGNDTITVGDGMLSDLQETASVSGGSGTDTLVFDNSLDATAESQTLSSASFAQGTQTFSFDAIESINVKEGPGGTSAALNVVPVSTTINGNTGADFVSIGAGNLDTNLLANVTFNGGGGTDQLLLDNRLASANSNYTISNSLINKLTGFIQKTVTISNLESETVKAGSGDDVITASSVSVPLTITSGGGNDSITASNSGDVTVDTGAQGTGTGDQLVVNPSGTSALMKLNIVDTIGSIMTSVGGTLQITAHGIAINTHDLTLRGVIDLAGGAMIVQNAADLLTTYHTWILGGYNNGTWTGTSSKIGKVPYGAFNSSLAALNPEDFAVGFAPASALYTSFPATFLGQSVIDTDMLVRYTVQGDANLDGKTNALDFNALATSYGATSADWYQGDFNYDHSVNTLDFNMLATHFNASLPAHGAVPDAAPVASSRADLSLFSDRRVSDDPAPDVLM